MQLEKEKKEKQERERCRALAQRIAEEAAAASAALLGEQSLLLTKALRRAGVAAEAWAEGSEAELLVVVDPAYETLPEKHVFSSFYKGGAANRVGKCSAGNGRQLV